MIRLSLLLIALALLASPAIAQTIPTQVEPAKTPATVTAPATPAPTSVSEAALDRLAQSNSTLLDLLKKQQAVLEDIQYDRRLQSRQIEQLEERLEESLQENAKLQDKIATLEAAAIAPQPGQSTQPEGSASAQGSNAAPAPDADSPPPPPSTYLPPPDSEGAPGTKSWHRLFTLSGTDGKNSDIFHITGRTWRVLWHNLDKPGKSYENTSALFIHAFPKDDTIPQQVCAKVGTGGDATELLGPGNYYLKIEASGGSWELAVEDFQ